MRSILPRLLLACALLATPALAAQRPDSRLGDGGVSAFYDWPGPVPATPGTLLRTEELPPEMLPEGAARGLRILYSSTDGLDGHSPVVSSGAVFLPRGAPPPGGWPLLAWGHGTVGTADVCAPSWTGSSARDGGYLGGWLARGYAIVAPDYQGLGTAGGHPYLATRPAARSVLDAIRAVQRQGLAGRRTMLAGQSQGAGAVVAAAAHAPDYAPELEIRGTVATGTPYFPGYAPPPDPRVHAADVNAPGFGYALLILSLLEQAEPGFRIEDYVTQDAMPVIRAGATGCLGEMMRAAFRARLRFETTFRQDPTPAFTRAYPLLTYGRLDLPQPLFLGIGGADRDVPPEDQQRLFADACRAGTRVEAHLYPGLGHSAALPGSQRDAFAFADRVMAGGAVAGNCGAIAVER
ncbi:lipase family protein [Roseomonas marmotae]|uniref:Alpha/beta hydrolase n=1 Tax=Roseomonas marmotae TaxID=2768161 RepID=A0ABS3KK00_9PROT|nr:lipase family protein [Roseomonas marmotae]MBO1076656.1 alpha/beta hydrolase [Roseomonas marmotae]QTI79607.1 alpha/beta hydrolase [Roseomonas marmotae]